MALERLLVPTVPPWLTGVESQNLLDARDRALWQKIVFLGGRSRGRLTVVPGVPPFALWQRHGRPQGPLRSQDLAGLTYGNIITDRCGLWQAEAMGEAADGWVAWLGEGAAPAPPGDRLLWENWLALRRDWGI
ncbi:MAG: hypothetical protein HC918_08090 [Oscillatoriales cyanobacterium SM2_1_8]|nr:hypothetical protein [Oscillatoriales cyanobacterium SM2_1_8]